MLDKQFILSQIEDSFNLKKEILDNQGLVSMIQQVSETICKSYQNNNKILLAGNGGSAADAQHIAGELVCRFYFDRPPLPAISLSTDPSIMTSISNDYGYDSLFARQIEAYGQKGDVFIGISTSGTSKNIIAALQVCKSKEIITVGLTGESGCEMAAYCDYCLQIPSRITPRIQEAHILIGHIICSYVEKSIFVS